MEDNDSKNYLMDKIKIFDPVKFGFFIKFSFNAD